MKKRGLSLKQRIFKRAFDLIGSLVGFLLLFPLLIFSWLLAAWTTRSNGFFIQKRVGLNAKLFYVIKLRTMIDIPSVNTNITRDGDPRITKVGVILRKSKLDEIPQLLNVLFGSMSLVGPRPDVEGFADKLKDEERLILSIKPGITGPASIYFKNEEKLLAKLDNAETINQKKIWPKKVQINMNYILEYSLFNDFVYLLQTIFGGGYICSNLNEL